MANAPRIRFARSHDFTNEMQKNIDISHHKYTSKGACSNAPNCTEPGRLRVGWMENVNGCIHVKNVIHTNAYTSAMRNVQHMHAKIRRKTLHAREWSFKIANATHRVSTTVNFNILQKTKQYASYTFYIRFRQIKPRDGALWIVLHANAIQQQYLGNRPTHDFSS